jgi:hypothetical protein
VPTRKKPWTVAAASPSCAAWLYCSQQYGCRCCCCWTCCQQRGRPRLLLGCHQSKALQMTRLWLSTLE